VLLLLDAREPESQQETAERLQVDRTTMVSLLDGLETKGLVARQADPRDRRRNVVALTPTGRRTLEKAVRASDEAEDRLLDPLDKSEKTQLRALLARLGADGRPDV
jgi:DNA-binding MarR family transcriptional regulator